MCAAERKHNDDNPKQFEIGKYIFEWKCIAIDNTLLITVTETLTKDEFSHQYTMEQLKEMKFFKSNMKDIKCFIEKVMFNNTNEMFYQIGFVTYNTQDEGHKSLQTDKYTENDKILIILSYQNEWIQSKWELTLDYIAQTSDIKLQSIIRDLQFKNRQLTKQIDSMKDSIVPTGAIVMWSGATHNTPKGWALCNGLNNTPDLRDKFVFGAGGQYNSGAVGGQTKHSHNVTVYGTKLNIKHIPQHQHHIKRDYWDIHSGGGGNKYRVLCANSDGDRNVYTNYIGGGDEHDHSSYCTKTSHMPPFIALGYIMKI